VNGLIKFKAPVISKVIEETKEEKTPIITEISELMADDQKISELVHDDQIDLSGLSSDSE